MCIPMQRQGLAQQRASLAQLAKLKSQLTKSGLALDTLSMGMSNDMEAAIAEGSTLLRIGSALFGERQKNVTNP